MHSMSEVHQLAAVHHDELVRDADRQRMLRDLEAAPGHTRVGRVSAAWWAELAAVLIPWRRRKPEAAGR